jgi:Branched-chain amino acid transport protein (AzlD)
MSGWQGFFILVAIAVLAHEPWRWAGYMLGRRLNPDDEIFKWVKAVSTSLVAALAARLMLFPSGALAGIPLWLRLAGCAVGIAVFYAANKTAWKGVCAGALIVCVGKLAVG